MMKIIIHFHAERNLHRKPFFCQKNSKTFHKNWDRYLRVVGKEIDVIFCILECWKCILKDKIIGKISFSSDAGSEDAFNLCFHSSHLQQIQ